MLITICLILSLNLFWCSKWIESGFIDKQALFCSNHFFYLSERRKVFSRISFSLLKVMTTAPANKFIMKKLPKMTKITKPRKRSRKIIPSWKPKLFALDKCPSRCPHFFVRYCSCRGTFLRGVHFPNVYKW